MFFNELPFYILTLFLSHSHFQILDVTCGPLLKLYKHRLIFILFIHPLPLSNFPGWYGSSLTLSFHFLYYVLFFFLIFLKLSSFFNNKNKFNWCWNKNQENLYGEDIKNINQQQIHVYCTCKICCTAVYKRNNILFPMPSKTHWDKQGMAIPLHGTGACLRRSLWSKILWPPSLFATEEPWHTTENSG